MLIDSMSGTEALEVVVLLDLCLRLGCFLLLLALGVALTWRRFWGG